VLALRPLHPRSLRAPARWACSAGAHQEKIDIFPGKALDNELSGNVVDICPVGALLDKDFLFQRVWNLQEAASIDGITARATTSPSNTQRGQGLPHQAPHQPHVNKWWISDEIRYGWKFVHDPLRISEPLWLETGSQQTCDWDQAQQELLHGLRQAIKQDRHVALMLSPMLSCEDAYLMTKFIRAFDPKSTIGIGPVPRSGEDHTFPGGYTVYAEKAPNARGVRRAAELVTGRSAVLDYDAFYQLLNADDAREANIGAVLFTGNYPSTWVTTLLLEAIGQRFVGLIDTLPNPLSVKAHIVLPGATWLEKSGTFENIDHRIQAFEQAIAPVQLARPEAQIALDLMAAADLAQPVRYDPVAVRREMGEPFADITQPPPRDLREPDMQYVEF
jgi:NADH-quinone oxidoreductase subunit G